MQVIATPPFVARAGGAHGLGLLPAYYDQRRHPFSGLYDNAIASLSKQMRAGWIVFQQPANG